MFAPLELVLALEAFHVFGEEMTLAVLSVSLVSSFDTAEAFAIKDGKFIAVGSNTDVQKKYTSSTIIDAKYQTIIPGLIDAHCHFYRFGLQLQKIDVSGTKSYDEIVDIFEVQPELQIELNKVNNF